MEKILKNSELQQWLSAFRRSSQKLVFTNGCFDILHAGHVKYLQIARNLGNALMVGLNSDASIHQLKGPQRPIVKESDRALVLTALEAIDVVILFDELTPECLIKKVIPDILVKGGDYRPQEIIGYDTVTSNGGRVEVIPFLEGRSSSRLIEKIKEQL